MLFTQHSHICGLEASLLSGPVSAIAFSYPACLEGRAMSDACRDRYWPLSGSVCCPAEKFVTKDSPHSVSWIIQRLLEAGLASLQTAPEALGPCVSEAKLLVLLLAPALVAGVA